MMDNNNYDIDWGFVGHRIYWKSAGFGYTEKEFADHVGISVEKFLEISNGDGLKELSIDTLCKIANALHISIDDLLYRDQFVDGRMLSRIMGSVMRCPETKLNELNKVIDGLVFMYSFSEYDIRSADEVIERNRIALEKGISKLKTSHSKPPHFYKRN